MDRWEKFEGLFDNVADWFCLAICSGFFLGFLPGKIMRESGKGGGLAGSILGWAIAVPFILADNGCLGLFYLAVVSFLIGGILVERAEEFMVKKWGAMKRHTGVSVFHDFNQTCIDEVHGILVAILPVFIIPAEHWGWRLIASGTAFALFRLFDARKTWLVGKAERRWPVGAFGIMFDDTVAGAMSAGVILIPCLFIRFFVC